MRLAILFIILIVPLKIVFAEEIGKLPDGRAYRTAADGSQVVDYIAQLEVENKTLRQKLSETANCACTEMQCDIYISEVERRSRELISEQQINLKNAQDAAAKCTPNNSQLASLPELENIKAELDAARAVIAELQTRKNSEQIRASFFSEENNNLNKNSISQPIPAIKLNAPEIRKIDAIQPSQVVASQVEANRAQQFDLKVPENTAQLETVNKLNKVIQLRKERDKLYSAYNSSAVKVSKSQIKTKNGHTPEDLLSILSKTSDLKKQSLITKETERMLKVVNSDLALLKRLSRATKN